MLHVWSLEGNPKFYAFLKTDLGKSLGSWFGWWGSPLEVPISDKPYHKLSDDEREVGLELGQLASAKQWGIEPTYRDIRFRKDFPNMSVHIEVPFMVVSDLPKQSAGFLFDELHLLHRDFLQTFSGLIGKKPRQQLIHVLVFDKTESYKEYERLCHGEPGETAGFYSPTADRLVLHNPLPQHMEAPATQLQTSLRITLRHEGTHQLCFAFGVHSDHRIEHEWLLEGLASYCEEQSIGEISSENSSTLRRAIASGEIIPVIDLINFRSQRGLLAYRKSALAYAESWSLVHMLMQPEYRPLFERYILYVRDPSNFNQLRFQARSSVLCQMLELSQQELDQAWLEYVIEIVKGSHTPVDVASNI